MKTPWQTTTAAPFPPLKRTSDAIENFLISVSLPWRLQPSNLNINFTHHDVVHVDIVHPDVIHCDVDVFRSKDSIFSSLNKELAPAVAWPKCRPRRRRIFTSTATLNTLFVFRFFRQLAPVAARPGMSATVTPNLDVCAVSQKRFCFFIFLPSSRFSI